MSIVNLALSPNLVNLLQDRTLERQFHDALYPRLLYRSEAMPERWEANIGQRQIFTRKGLIDVDVRPITPGSDPSLGTYGTEQWEVEAAQFGKAMDTHMPTSRTAIAPTFLADAQTLGLHAGQTMSRLPRNKLFVAYLGGDTVNTAVVAIGVTAVPVASINGFTEILVNGRLQPVSPANPLAVTFTGGEPANTVVAATPNDPADPFGPGVLTLGAVTTAGLALRSAVRAVTRSRITRVGAGATVDGLVGTSVLTLQTIIDTVARMRAQNVPPTADGFYHVHVTPVGEAELFADNAFQRLFQSLPENAVYRDLGIGQLVGCRFYRNTENPDLDNSGPTIATGLSALVAGQIGGEVQNGAGLAIQRALVIGGGALYEKYIDESEYITEAGVQGKIGEFSIVNGGVQIMTQRIRYILRSPQDRLQQIVGHAWSWSGDFAVPSDGLVGNRARFKRCTVIEHV